MVNFRRHPLHFLIVLTIVIILGDESNCATRTSSFRSSSRVSSYRSSTSRYGSVRGTGFSTLSMLVFSRFSYRVNRLAYTRGIFFTSSSRRSSYSSYSEGTTICFNVQESLAAQHSSSVMVPWVYQNRTVYGLFVCPMDDGQADRTYCCGDEDKQRCCTFWDEAGRVAGLFLGLFAGLGLLAFIGFKLYKRWRRKSQVSNQQAIAQAVAQETVNNQTSSTVGLQQPMVAPLPNPYDSGAYYNPQFKPPSYGSEQPGSFSNPPYPMFPPPPYFEAIAGQTEMQPAVRITNNGH